jgi:hypothetical protein
VGGGVHTKCTKDLPYHLSCPVLSRAKESCVALLTHCLVLPKLSRKDRCGSFASLQRSTADAVGLFVFHRDPPSRQLRFTLLPIVDSCLCVNASCLPLDRGLRLGSSNEHTWYERGQETKTVSCSQTAAHASKNADVLCFVQDSPIDALYGCNARTIALRLKKFQLH